MILNRAYKCTELVVLFSLFFTSERIGTLEADGVTIRCKRSPVEFEKLKKKFDLYNFHLADASENGKKLMYKYKKGSRQ